MSFMILGFEWRTMTERIDAVIYCTPIRVKNKAKLTNLMKLSRIEGYNGKWGSNPQQNKVFVRDLLEFDQIGWWIGERN